MENIKHCNLSDLVINDRVKIKHFHLYKNGYWQLPSIIEYKYVGKLKEDIYHFKNVKYDYEGFYMKKENEENNIFLGKING